MNQPRIIYPDISDILARKEEGRQEVGRRSFGEKIAILEKRHSMSEGGPLVGPAKQTRGTFQKGRESQIEKLRRLKNLRSSPSIFF